MPHVGRADLMTVAAWVWTSQVVLVTLDVQVVLVSGLDSAPPAVFHVEIMPAWWSTWTAWRRCLPPGLPGAGRVTHVRQDLPGAAGGVVAALGGGGIDLGAFAAR